MGDIWRTVASEADSFWDWLTSVTGAWVVGVVALALSLVNLLGDRARLKPLSYSVHNELDGPTEFVSFSLMNVGKRAVPLDHIFAAGSTEPLSRTYPGFADDNPVTPCVLNAFGVLKWDIPANVLTPFANGENKVALKITWYTAPTILWFAGPKERTLHVSVIVRAT